MKIKFYSVALLALALALLAAGCGKKDADIQKAVQDKLTADGVAGVSATVKDGVATLTGEVADITVKTKAENSAKAVDGVKSVTNNITLKPLPVATPAASDQALKGKIEENWKKVGCTGATVEVKDGVATVSGTVPEAKYAQCIQVLNESGAVKPVNNLQKGK
ncbi:MAG TPA: BON domain-containing protein [Pyrinomonadaceae bacterium]|jgi:hyperosmotically inducible periplasmic protein|nr:BON domain-containing protein [Pyrinomonadaceae bacterium]